jgi:glycosyltransferase involved in cell wall biosynthesis
MNVKLLSLIVPAYKQEKTIVKDLQNLDKVLSTLPCKHEIIIVVDGFVDKTYEKVLSLKSEIRNLKVFGYTENRGKGAAIKLGVEKADGDVIGFIDAGMDIDPSEISLMLDLMDWNKADIIVGSKLHPESKVDYPFIRKVFSWIYRNFTHLLFGFNVKDTQVGLKLFTRKVVKNVFPKLSVNRFAFDIEILAVAYSLGYRKISETPVRIKFRNNSSIPSIFSLEFWRVITNIIYDTLKVFYMLKFTNHYHK